MINEDTQAQLRAIKKEFMAYRNGIVADTLRRAGMTVYDVIFGLNLPQLSTIARSGRPSRQLAEALWQDRKVRESRLLALYIYPSVECGREAAISMMEDVQTREEADILCFRLLRFLPFAGELLDLPSVKDAYVREALKRNLDAM